MIRRIRKIKHSGEQLKMSVPLSLASLTEDRRASGFSDLNGTQDEIIRSSRSKQGTEVFTARCPDKLDVAVCIYITGTILTEAVCLNPERFTDFTALMLKVNQLIMCFNF